jgi:hypothetical protein
MSATVKMAVCQRSSSAFATVPVRRARRGCTLHVCLCVSVCVCIVHMIQVYIYTHDTHTHTYIYTYTHTHTHLVQWMTRKRHTIKIAFMRESILISDSTRFVSFSTRSKKVACLLASATSGLAHLCSYMFVRRRGGQKREREKKEGEKKGP